MIDWPMLEREVTILGEFISDHNDEARQIIEKQFVDFESSRLVSNQSNIRAMTERIMVRFELGRRRLPEIEIGKRPDAKSLDEIHGIVDGYYRIRWLSDEIDAVCPAPAMLPSSPKPRSRGLVIPTLALETLEGLVRHYANSVDGALSPLRAAIGKLPEKHQDDESGQVRILSILNRSHTSKRPEQIRLEMSEGPQLTSNTIQKYLKTMSEQGCVFKAGPGDGYGLYGKHEPP